MISSDAMPGARRKQSRAHGAVRGSPSQGVVDRCHMQDQGELKVL